MSENYNYKIYVICIKDLNYEIFHKDLTKVGSTLGYLPKLKNTNMNFIVIIPTIFFLNLSC